MPATNFRRHSHRTGRRVQLRPAGHHLYLFAGRRQGRRKFQGKRCGGIPTSRALILAWPRLSTRGKFTEALAAVNSAEKIEPGNSNYHNLKGQVLIRLGRAKEGQAESKSHATAGSQPPAPPQRNERRPAAPAETNRGAESAMTSSPRIKSKRDPRSARDDNPNPLSEIVQMLLNTLSALKGFLCALCVSALNFPRATAAISRTPPPPAPMASKAARPCASPKSPRPPMHTAPPPKAFCRKANSPQSPH